METTPIRDGEGKISTVMEMSTDVTQIKRLQAQLDGFSLSIDFAKLGNADREQVRKLLQYAIGKLEPDSDE